MVAEKGLQNTFRFRARVGVFTIYYGDLHRIIEVKSKGVGVAFAYRLSNGGKAVLHSHGSDQQ